MFGPDGEGFQHLELNRVTQKNKNLPQRIGVNSACDDNRDLSTRIQRRHVWCCHHVMDQSHFMTGQAVMKRSIGTVGITLYRMYDTTKGTLSHTTASSRASFNFNLPKNDIVWKKKAPNRDRERNRDPGCAQRVDYDNSENGPLRKHGRLVVVGFISQALLTAGRKSSEPNWDLER